MTWWTDPKVIARFWSKVDRQDDDTCWLWTGSGSRSASYGQVRVGGHAVNAHHASLCIALGRELRPGYEACHTCDVRLCVNPTHLWEGTRGDNIRDMVMKGRHNANPQPGRPKPAGFGEKMRAVRHAERRTCACGMTTNAGAMARHKKVSGHG